MSYTLTLGQIKQSSIRNISGVCVDSPEFSQAVNDITRRLMRRGGWWQTELVGRFCTNSCSVVWPRQVGTILGLRFCRSGAAMLRNVWWSVYGFRSSCGNWPAGWRGDMVVRDDGTRACFSEISGTSGKYLRLHISKHDDIGKTLRVFGTQYGGQPLQEQNSAGDWVMGITITATQLDTTTSILVTKITSIIKEETQGRMWLYSVDPSSGDLEMLGQYEHDETNPAYRCSVIQNFGNVPYFTDANGRRMRSVEALFKAEWIPVREDTDFSLLDNEDAIKLGFQAWRLEEANDDAGAEIKWAKAIRELNFSIRDREPSMSTTIRVNSISSNYPICNPC